MDDRRMRRARGCSLPAFSLLFVSGFSFAADFTVNQTLDEIDASPGDGICATASGSCSLRAAIMESNALSGSDNIILPAGNYALSLVGTGDNQAIEGDLDISDDLNLSGAGADLSLIDAGNEARALHLLPKDNGELPVISISGIGVRNGLHNQSTQGSLVWNQAELTLDSVHISNGGDGSTAVRNEAQLRLNKTRLHDNTRALINSGGRLIARSSQFVDNGSEDSSLDGAGLYNFEGQVSLEDVGFSGNSARNGGGFYSVAGDVFATGLMVSGNTANAGGGLFSSTSRIVISNSLFDGNQATRSSGSHGGGIASTGSLYLSDSVISGNQSNSLGGGISIKGGRLTLSRVDLLDNQILASDGDGGGLGIRGLNDGEVAHLSRLTVRGNRAADAGGGIFSASDFQLEGSEISANHAARGAGLASTTLAGEISNASIAGNIASTRGGGIFLGPTANRYTLNLRHVSLSTNQAPGDQGANLSRYRGTLTLSNSLLGGPIGASNCDTDTVSLGGNIASDNSCDLADISDLVSVDPQLLLLEDNGGDNLSLLPDPASPAIDHGLPAYCPSLDQRGHYRSGDCDAGAVELGSAPADAGSISFAQSEHRLSESDPAIDIQLQRSGAAQGQLSLRVFDITATGDALPGADYTSVDAQVHWADGEAGSKSISLTPIDDALEESTERLLLGTLGALQNTSANDLRFTIILIHDNDARPGQLAFEQPGHELPESTSELIVTVIRSDGSFGEVSVNYATADLAATGGEDYAVTQGTLYFEHGQESASFSLPFIDDDMEEGDETFQLTLSDPSSGASLGEWRQIAVTILDDDQPQHGRISFNTTTAAFDESDGVISITVQRLDGSDGAVSIDYRIEFASAGEGDVQPLSGTLQFAEGQISAEILLTLLDDSLHESAEQFRLLLENPLGGAGLGANNSLDIEIRDNDPAQPGEVSFSGTNVSTAESHGTLLVEVQRSGGTDGPISVDYTAIDISAVSGSDYQQADGTLEFGDGVNSATIRLQIIDDAAHEETERLRLRLSNPTGGARLGDQQRLDISIIDDDPLPMPGALRFEHSELNIGEAAGTLRLTVLRSGGSDGAISVAIDVRPDSSHPGEDFQLGSTSLQFADGQSSANIELSLIDDDLVEGDEHFRLQLSRPTGGAALGDPAQIEITLEDNDHSGPQPGNLAWAEPSLTVRESDGQVKTTVLRTDGSDGEVTVQWRTVADTASAGNDFVDASGSITFADGQTEASIGVQLLDDAQQESDERFQLQLSDPGSGATLGTPVNLTIHITDDDEAPATEAAVIRFATAELKLEEFGGTVDVIVQRSGDTGGVVTVNYASVDDTAEAGSDYAELSGTLRLDAGETQSVLRLTLLDDELQEEEERFWIELEIASGDASLGSPSRLSITLTANDKKTDGSETLEDESGGGGTFAGGLLACLIYLICRRFSAIITAKFLCIAASVCSLHLRSVSHTMRHEWAPKCRTARSALDITNSTPPMENHRP